VDATVYERVLNVAQRLAGSADLDEVLAAVIDALRDVLRAERASVFQFVPAPDEGREGARTPREVEAVASHGESAWGSPGQDGSFFATKAHGLPGDMTLPGDAGLIGEAARTRRLINTPDARRDPRFNAEVDRCTGFETRSILTIPLLDERRELVGVAQALNKRSDERAEAPGDRAARGDAEAVFTVDDESIASHLAAIAGVALRRAALLAAARRREALEAELRVARLIQRASVPGRDGEVSVIERAGLRIAGAWAPASETAGDVWDAFAAPRDAEATWLLLADAAGHGVGPALSVSRVSAMLHACTAAGVSLAETAGIINRRLSEELPPGLFVTAFIARASRAREANGGVDVEYVAGGQAPILIWRRDDGDVRTLGATAPPLGVTEWDAPARDCVGRTTIRRGEALLVVSDGVLEAGAARSGRLGDSFGVAGVRRTLKADDGLADAAGRLLAAVADRADDDRTVLAIEPM